MHQARVLIWAPLALSAPLTGGCSLFGDGWDLPEGGDETGGDADKTFFMAEVTTYSSAPILNCKATDLAKVTEAFKQTLLLNGWSGQAKSSYETRPSDFYDKGYGTTPYGTDHLHADAHRVAVFAGHGNIGYHGFILTDPEYPNECRGFTSLYLGGQGQGDQQSLFINAASCGGAFGDDPNEPAETCFKDKWSLSQFRQWLGFADSPVIDPAGLSTFYETLPANYDALTGNVDTWLDVMEFPESGAPTAPVAYTKVSDEEVNQGTSEALHYEMNMRSGKYMGLADNPSQKFEAIMSPAYPIDGIIPFCTGDVFKC